jgi:hypothetical protein
MSTYAATWRDECGVVQSGRLELGQRALLLDGGRYRSGQRSALRVLYRDIVRVDMAPFGARLDDQPTIALTGTNRSLYLAPAGLGLAREILGLLQLAGLS